MATPLGRYTNPKRRTGLAGVSAIAESAGTIASSSGSARAVPIPVRNLRRGSAIFVTNIEFLVACDARLSTSGAAERDRQDGAIPGEHQPPEPFASGRDVLIWNGVLFTTPMIKSEVK